MTYAPNPYPPGYPSGYGYPPPAPQAPVDTTPRRYSMWAGYFLFWSPNLWRDAGRKWKGMGFWFSFILLLVTWIPCFVKLNMLYKSFLANDAPKLTNQIPPITITNGVVSSPVAQPYHITDPQTGRDFAILDTTGTVTEAPKPQGILLTSNSLVYRENPYKVQTHDLSNVQSFSMDSKSVTGWLELVPTLMWTIALPVVVLWSIFWRVLAMLGIAGIGMSFNGNARLSYGGMLRLTAISFVWFTLVDTVFWFVGITPGCWWWIGGALLTLIPLYFAVKANGSIRPPTNPTGFPVYPAATGYGLPPAGGYHGAPPGGYPAPTGFAPPPPPVG